MVREATKNSIHLKGRLGSIVCIKLFSFYFVFFVIIIIFSVFLNPQSAVRTPHLDSAFSEHPQEFEYLHQKRNR